MRRYFLEVAYKGTNYSGSQVQQNANSIQAEIEKAFTVLQSSEVSLTGSSRTDAGVHALQNFFHFDYGGELHPHFTYKINAILPADIVVRKIIPVNNDAHCRFDAVSREYKYFIYQEKNPFLQDRAFYFPYTLEFGRMQETAEAVKDCTDFTSFSKRNTQAKTFICRIAESYWEQDNGSLIFHVTGDRFLRGMVRALVGSMLEVGRGKLTTSDFRDIVEARDRTGASFAVPPHGLYLVRVNYPDGFFLQP